ncbi:MAG: M55 family metallopeptidase [Patulibacter sp.]|nr:M55 family metallopeptidase [Patulibacter sp.]
MRVLISADMEGVAGVVEYDDVRPGTVSYERCRRLLTDEVSAAVRGVFAVDPQADVLVADSHGDFRNILPDGLDRRARLVRGRPRRHGQLAGIEDGADAVILVGYHAKAGVEHGVLAHTVAGQVIFDVRCDGRSLGEIGLNVAYAAAHGVPTVLVTGDEVTAAEARDVSPGIHTVAVKQALGGWAAASLHPDEACARIEAAVPGALAARESIRPLRFDGPVSLEIDLVRPVMGEPVLLVPGIERCGDRGVRYAAPDFETAYRIVELVATIAPVGSIVS